MKLPKLTTHSNKEKLFVFPKGIDRENVTANYLEDSVNLTFDSGCKTRNSRKPILFLDFTPEQTEVLNNRLFIRCKNMLYEIELLPSGEPCKIKESYTLKQYQNPPNRHIIIKDNNLYILPDGIMITKEEEFWDFLGIGNSVSAALPFKNGRTLYYPSGFDGDEVCNGVGQIKLGTKMRFNWISDKVFTVVKLETVTSPTIDGLSSIFMGTNICLDKAVENWKSLPKDATVQIMQPNTTPILNSLHLGIDQEISFTSHGISHGEIHNGLTYDAALEDFLHVGQRFKISGSTVEYNNKEVTVRNYGNGIIAFNENLFEKEEPYGTEIVLTPVFPDFEHLLFTEGRIIGADNKNKTLWISSKENPFVFYTDTFTENGVWYSNLISNITAIVPFNQNVFCYMAKGGFKIMGDNPLNFKKLSIPVSGISSDKSKSLAQIGDTLFYCSAYGIMKYSVGSDKTISSPLGFTPEVTIGAASKGKYFAKANDRLWVYDLSHNKWWSENAENIDYIFEIEDNIYFIYGKVIYSNISNDFKHLWSLETTQLPIKSQEKIRPISILAELKSSTGAELSFYAKSKNEDSYKMLFAKHLKGYRTITVPLKMGVCNGVTFLIKGIGQCEIKNLSLNYRRI